MLKYENWRELARNCQESGMSVNGWSKLNHIPTTTCRQWLARLKKEEQILQNQDPDHELSVWGKVDLESQGQNASMDCHHIFPSAIKLNYRGWNMEISADFDPLLLSRIMKVVESVC